MMIVFSGNKLYKEHFDESDDRFVREEFGTNDSLLYHYKDPVVFEEDTTLENIIWAYINDINSNKLFDSLRSVTDYKNVYSFFHRKLISGSNGILRNKIDWIEFSPMPVIGFQNSHDRNGFDSNFFKFHEEDWGLVGWYVEEGKIESVNISTFSLNRLLDISVELDGEVPVYDDNWNYEGFYEDIPSVSDVLECICYEFYYYREVEEEDQDDKRNNMISLTDLLEERKD